MFDASPPEMDAGDMFYFFVLTEAGFSFALRTIPAESRSRLAASQSADRPLSASASPVLGNLSGTGPGISPITPGGVTGGAGTGAGMADATSGAGVAGGAGGEVGAGGTGVAVGGTGAGVGVGFGWFDGHWSAELATLYSMLT